MNDEDLTKIKDIAEGIRRFSHVADALAHSGLNQRAIIVLLKDATGIPQKEIKVILETMPRLKELYCRDPSS
jgi:hypothetical protein